MAQIDEIKAMVKSLEARIDKLERKHEALVTDYKEALRILKDLVRKGAPLRGT